MPASWSLLVNQGVMIVAAKPLVIVWLSALGVRYWLAEKLGQAFLLQRWIFKIFVAYARRSHRGVGQQLLIVQAFKVLKELAIGFC